MTCRAHLIGFLCTTLPLASAVGAQAVPQQVRFLIATDGENRQWQGYLARLTPDSLYVAIRGPDTIAVFARRVVRSMEHERRVSPGRAAVIGCGVVGAALGALGYFGTHDPDSPGIEKPVGILSAVVGCACGAVSALVVSAVRSHGWEPWILPDSIGSPLPPNDSLSPTNDSRMARASPALFVDSFAG